MAAFIVLLGKFIGMGIFFTLAMKFKSISQCRKTLWIDTSRLTFNQLRIISPK
jgi:hypothetical protein